MGKGDGKGGQGRGRWEGKGGGMEGKGEEEGKGARGGRPPFRKFLDPPLRILDRLIVNYSLSVAVKEV